MRRVALGAACTCLALAACATDTEHYTLRVSLTEVVPDLEGRINGVPLAGVAEIVTFEFSTYEAALRAPPVTVELYRDGLLFDREVVAPGASCAKCADDVGQPVFEFSSYTLGGWDGGLSTPSYACQATEGECRLEY